jgi:hypothetical protein
MVIAMMLAAQAAVPNVRSDGPPRIYDYRFTCNLFGADGARVALNGSVDHAPRWGPVITMTSSSSHFPVDRPRTPTPDLHSSEFLHRVVRGRRAYNYRFQFPPGPPYTNGIVTVSMREGDGGDIPYVATGLCDVTRAEAPSR